MKLEVIKSNRKTCEIKVNVDGSVTLKVPKHYTNQMIQTIITDKKEWIDKKIELMGEYSQEKPRLSFELESSVPIWYEEYTFKVSDRAISYIDPTNKQIHINPKVGMAPDAIKLEFIKLARVTLKDYLEARINELAAEMALRPNTIRIKLMRSRWGSCSSKGNLNFSLNLILIPKDMVDYIIIHELAHLVELNHSKAYWKIVEKYYPMYLESRNWLKLNTLNLSLN